MDLEEKVQEKDMRVESKSTDEVGAFVHVNMDEPKY